MSIFKGTFTALITPFLDNKIDYASLDKLIDHQLSSGITGFVVNGTTGESPTLTDKEKDDLLSHIRNKVGSKIPLIMGTGSNDTAKSVYESKKAEKLGADAILVVVPYYNKPPQRGLVKHFKAIADAVSVPVILYNVPGRTITSLSVESTTDLSKVANIIGIKDATGNISIAEETLAKTEDGFILLSGDDGSYVDFLCAGGHGVISVASHVIPKQMVYWKLWVAEGNIERAKNDISKYKKLIDLLFVEANPIPVKKAVQLMGLISSAELRSPLVELSEEHTLELQREMKNLGII